MSCFIYGYFQCSIVKDYGPIMAAVENLGLGVAFGNDLGLENFQKNYLPDTGCPHLKFEIGSRVGSNDATMLLWSEDLDPNHSMGVLPYKLEDRVRLLNQALQRIIEYFGANKFVVALTDSCQIESVVSCNFLRVENQFLIDCKEKWPPNRLYFIT